MKRSAKTVSALLAALMLTASVSACSPTPQQAEQEDMTSIPAYFSLIDEGRIGVPGRQHETGMCWSYYCTAVAESAILTAGLAEADEINLSEGHLCYYMYQDTDEMTDKNRDGFYISADSPVRVKLPYHAGGDPEVAFGMYANGCGLGDESCLPPFNSDTLNSQKSFQALYDGVHSGAISEQDGDWLLVGWNNCIGRSADEIKREIMKNGAMGAGILAASDGVCKAEDGTRAFFYCSDEETFGGGSHAIVLIGWDDSYSREHFNADHRPQNDGAWIARDSTDLLSGEDGLMYISYEEFIMGVATAEMCDRSDYGAVLHHDVLCKETIRGASGSTTVANVFASKYDGALKGVGIYTAADDQPVKIQVYINPKSDKPDSGRRAAKLETTVPCAGYHVLDLKKQCKLAAGDTFSVVVSYEGGESDEKLGSAFVEGTQLTESCHSLVEMHVTSGKGESFVKIGKEWLDTSEETTAKAFGKDEKLNNVGIRALLAAE